MSKLHSIRVRWNAAALLGLGALGAVLVLAGCSREEVRVYRVPKEEPRLTSVSAPSSRPGQSAVPHLHWDLPPGWREVQGSSIRLATFSIPSEGGPPAEVSITPLPGVTGVESDAVDIWRSELGLARGSETGNVGEPISIGEISGTLYDLAGSDERGIIGAVATYSDSSWFFKMSGPASVVAREKEAFVGFLKSIEFHAEDHPEQTPAVAGRPSAPAGPVDSQRPPWEAPAHWQEFPPKTMLLANYSISGASSESGEVTVSAFPGDVGGLLANVNRWRRQIGMGAIGQSELAGISSPIEIQGARATLIDMTAEASQGKAPTRVLVAVVPRGAQTWFFKISGDEPLVAREKAAFLQFVQSVRFNHVS